MTAWDDMADALVASDLAETITYQAPGVADLTLTCVVAARDQEGQAGRLRARQDVLTLEVRRIDLPEPARGDRFLRGGLTYEVSADPTTDELGLFWRLTAYLVEAP